MNELLNPNPKIYEVIYLFIKSMVLITISFLMFLITAGLSLFTINHIIANFIDNKYTLSKQVFANLTIKRVFVEILLSLFWWVVIYVYTLIPIIYTGNIVYFIRGLNLFVLAQVMLIAVYTPRYLEFQRKGMINALKSSLILVNYKIGTSLFVLLFIVIITTIAFQVFGIPLFFSTIPMLYIINIIGERLFAAYVLKQGGNDE